MAGYFIMSLDFEAMWGAIGGIDNSNIEAFKHRVSKNQIVIPALLDLFRKYHLKATWGIVGGMFYKDSEDFNSHLTCDIVYPDWNLSIKQFVKEISGDVFHEFYSFKNLVQKVIEDGHQEIGSHTFSHYYSNEKGASPELLQQELELSSNLFKQFALDVRTIIFPRNQFKDSDIDVLIKKGYTIVRGQPSNYKLTKCTKLNKVLNFVDCYVPLFNRNYSLEEIKYKGICNVKATMLYRTWFSRLSLFEKLKIWRIKLAMTDAAKNNKCFHLWFHPHNMATNIDFNFYALESILSHYIFLKNKYGFKNKTMGELADLLV